MLSARNLKVGEIVYFVDQDGHGSSAKAKIVSIDGKKEGEVHFSGDELNVNVEVELLEDMEGVGNTEDIVNVNNQEVYKIIEGKTFQGEPVCYEHDCDIEYPYYCPTRDENCYGIELDDAPTKHEVLIPLDRVLKWLDSTFEDCRVEDEYREIMVRGLQSSYTSKEELKEDLIRLAETNNN